MVADGTLVPPISGTRTFYSRDGLRLAYYVLGPDEGRTILLLHGHTLSSWSNWIAPGHMAALADRGFRVVAADLRGHGASDAPHDPVYYRPGVLARDVVDLVAHLGLQPGAYDVAGYSISSRTTATALTMPDGILPGRVILGGMGLFGLTHAEERGGPIRRVLANPAAEFTPGSFEAEVAAELPEDADRVAQGLIPGTNVNIPRAELTQLALPVLVLMGDGDNECADARELARVLPNARYAEVPGIHMRTYRTRQFGDAVVEWMTGSDTVGARVQGPAAATPV